VVFIYVVQEAGNWVFFPSFFFAFFSLFFAHIFDVSLLSSL
jgi:hypothetical protein